MALSQSIFQQKHCAAQTAAGRQLQLIQVCIVSLQVGKKRKDTFTLFNGHNGSLLRRAATPTNAHLQVFCGLSVRMYMTLLMCIAASELFNHHRITCCRVEVVNASQIDEHALLTHPWELIE